MSRARAQGAVRWVLWMAVLIAAVAGAGYALFQYLRPLVVVTEAVEAPVVEAFYSTGTIQPDREYPLKSNIAGVLTDVRVDKGARVKRGDVLAVVSDPALEFTLRKAQAELAEQEKLADAKTSPAVAELQHRIEALSQIQDISKREVDRLQAMLARDAASQVDLDHAVDRLKTVWADLEANREKLEAKKLELQTDVSVARAAVDTAQWNVDQQTLHAPIDGAVLDRPASLGTRLAINDHVMQIADVRPENLVMRASVDEEDIAQVRVDQVVKMTLYSFPGEVFEGRVTKIYDKADPERRTFEVDVRLPRPEPRLAAGMTGELAFILSSKDKALVVPSQAIQDGAVWTISDGRLVRHAVKTGLRSVERTEILDGVAPGQQVVISPVGSMSPGHFVRESYTDPATAAGLNKPKVVTDGFKGFQ